jgi:hypothetical protein
MIRSEKELDDLVKQIFGSDSEPVIIKLDRSMFDVDDDKEVSFTSNMKNKM